MSDDLRTAIANDFKPFLEPGGRNEAIAETLADFVIARLHDSLFTAYGDGLTDGIKALLATAATDPVRRRALLDAMGLDVTEGVRYFDPANRRTGGNDWEVVPPFESSTGEPVLVVRPRGEATDV